jgi:hypothetical protein
MKHQMNKPSKKFASGGQGPKQHMFGAGDRTKTAPRDAAGAQTSGQTAQLSKRTRQRPVPTDSDNLAGDAVGTPGVSHRADRLQTNKQTKFLDLA